MSEDETKAEAVMDFVDMMIGALESGFVDSNTASFAEIHRVAENYILDTYAIEYDGLAKRWGQDIAELCGSNLATTEG